MQSSQTQARKDRLFWSRMRQDIALIHRSKRLDAEILSDAVKSELADILDQRIISYPPTLLKLGIDWYSTFEMRKEALGIENTPPVYTPAELEFTKLMAEKADNGRKANWQWRIAQEAEHKQKLGWYPFFITLTVNPDWTDPRQLWTEGREFRKFIRRLTKVVCKELGHPPAHKQKYSYTDVAGPKEFGKRRPRKKILEYDYRPEEDYVTYAGVIEHGKSREHHHAHILVWMREIPSKWKLCPNRYINDPKRMVNNECPSMRTLWKWSLPGLSKFNYYRTLSDRWSALGFVTPVIDGQPMKIAPAHATGRYIVKYLQKDFKEWNHRIKATRNLGIKKLKNEIMKLQPDQIESLTFRPKNQKSLHFLSMIHSAPLALVRSIAKQIDYWVKYRKRHHSLKTHLQTNSNSFIKMLRSVRCGARPNRMSSLDLYDWVSEFLPDQKGYCEKRMVSAHKLLASIFPRYISKTKPIKLGANRIGLTFSI